jgi:hypothetical protein
MFAQIAGRGAASGRRPNALLKNRSGPLILLLCTALLVQGCRTDPPPSPYTGRDPSDPRAPVARSTYQSTLGSYSSQRPVEPTPWREQNQGVAPAPKQ